MSENSDELWVHGHAATQMTGRSLYRLFTLALAGRLRTLLEPGRTVRFNRRDLEELGPAPKRRRSHE